MPGGIRTSEKILLLMRIAHLSIKNFRGVSEASIYFNGNSVLIGDNNAGKSTIFEAIDLVLGPDRLNRVPVVDEHDFYNGEYYIPNGGSPKIQVELVLIDLSAEQLARFKDNIEFWDNLLDMILPVGSIKQADSENVTEALRVKFIGWYNEEEDDFVGKTYFCSPEREIGTLSDFTKADKRVCGFLYLRALRTGARALSMERGSLLDIILRIKEIRPKMWENVLSQLKDTPVASEPEVGVTEVLEGIQACLKDFVPSDWGSQPILRVSDLTREHLRKTLTIFMSTGSGSYHAPFNHQGMGTVNTMVLALLTMIANEKSNVIFAMEEPEIAIPPYTQKRIVDSIRKKSTQALFSSHSPFVLEEFKPDNILLITRDSKGKMTGQGVHFPDTIKSKNYSQEFRLRFSEALLAKKVLLTEGATESTAYSAAGRRLDEIAPAKYSSLEAMGIAVFNVASDTALIEFGKYFRRLGKIVFAVYDKQTAERQAAIEKEIAYPFQSEYKGFEVLLVEETSIEVVKDYYKSIVSAGGWPDKLKNQLVNEVIGKDEDYKAAIFEFLKRNKGAYAAADLISFAEESRQIPKSIRSVFKKLRDIVEPKPVDQPSYE